MEEANPQPANTFQLKPLTPDQHPVTSLPKRATELPFFYLTKQKGQLQQNIRYEGIDEAGRPIRWTVRPNRDPEIGVPAIDAHEIWVRLIIPVMEQHRNRTGKILEILPLGGVRQCLRMLDWGEGGHQAKRLLRGLNQIGAAWCEADFFLPLIDQTGQQKLIPIKGKFSRLTIYAIGENHLTPEQLANGKFDFDFDLDATVYVQLHKLEMAIQESQDRRLFDNQYMFSVEPTGRRWLEIMAPKIFGVVKNKGVFCEIRYSWYVKQHHTLKRLYIPWRVTEQMNRVAHDHIHSGYILKPEYRTVKEQDQEVDFVIRYQPGPMATESTLRIRAHLKQSAGQNQPTEISNKAKKPRQQRLRLTPAFEPAPELESAAAPKAPVIDYRVVAELTKRGVGESKAREIIAALPTDFSILDTLEWGDLQIVQAKGSRKEIQNPPGFYIHLLEQRIAPPATFEGSQARQIRERAESERQESLQKEHEAAQAAEVAETASLTAQFEALPETDRLALLSEAKAEQLARAPQMRHWLETNSEANGFLLAAARRKLRDGWSPQSRSALEPNTTTQADEEPHYAINSDPRQAAPLQETSSVITGQNRGLEAIADSDFALHLKAILSTPQLSPVAVDKEPSVLSPAPIGPVKSEPEG